MKKIILGVIFFIFIFGGFSFASWNWKYYQIYTSKWENNKTTIFNGLINNNLSSSYYVNFGSIVPSSNTQVNRIEGDVIFVVQENGEFNVLTGLNVTDYNGSSNYFTAYKPGSSVNYANAICSTFWNGNILDVYIEGNGIYKNVVVGGQTLKIKIANLSSNFSILSTDGDLSVKNSGTLKIKIVDGYTTCADPKSILTYRILYFTRYYQDKSAPVASVGSLYLTGGTSYVQGTWVNEPVYVRIDCRDRPNDNPQRNSGCKDVYSIEKINTQITTYDSGLYYIVYDRTKPTPNAQDGYLSVNIAIDKLSPIFLDNIINFIGKNDITSGYNYRLSKDISEYTILADKYDISFSVKDPGEDCDAISKLCRGISGIKSIKVLADGTPLYTQTYSEYNSSKTLIKEDIKNINGTIDLTSIGDSGNRDVNFSIVIEDFAGNTLSRTWTLHIKPNKPYLDKFTISCLHGCSSTQYSTNELTDYFKYSVNIRDRWGNLVTKNISDVLLTTGSWLDKDTYDGNNLDDGNAIIIYNKNLFTPGKATFYLRSIVPGVFKREFLFKIPSFNAFYVNDGGIGTFKKDFNLTNEFIPSIKAGDLKIYDASGNVASLTGLSPNTLYTVKVPIISLGFDNTDYAYTIGDIKNGFVVLPEDMYEVVEVTGIVNNIKNSSESYNKTLEFKFRYNFKGGGIINKMAYFNFNPSVTLTNNLNTVKFPLYPNGGLQIGSGDDTRFRFSIIGFKVADGEMYAIGQGKKQFNMTTSKIKSKIKYNAYKYIKSIPANKVVNGVLIKNGNYEITLSEYNWLKTHNVNTLIVRNGNLTISTNIIKRIDMAVVVDDPNYEISNTTLNDYLADGNIIIKPNVRFINGLLYAEKSLLTADNNGKPLASSDEEKSSLLKNQLLFYGTIVSRNTVGGSILGPDGKYNLPGGRKTNDLNLASLFDIAFLRIGYNGYDLLPNSKFNNGIDDYVIVRYNPSIKLKPGSLLK